MIELSVNYKSSTAIEEIATTLDQIKENYSDVIFVNIGTDKCVGDSLAPLIGTLLNESNFKYPVYGTLDYPCHAVNLQSKINEVKRNHPNSLIIAIDACIGYKECIGEIQIKDCPIFPGKGVGKTLPSIGDVSIVGVVDTLDDSDLFTIRNIRFSLVYNMAKVLNKAILNVFDGVRLESAISY